MLGRFGLGESFAVACDGGREWIGLPQAEVLRRERELDQIVVAGHKEDRGLTPIELWADCGCGPSHRYTYPTARPLSPSRPTVAIRPKRCCAR